VAHVVEMYFLIHVMIKSNASYNNENGITNLKEMQDDWYGVAKMKKQG